MDEINLTNGGIPIWKTYLYQLQLQAPKPKSILCQKKLNFLPSQYGFEYHGMISRQESEQLLGNEDGNFLVRESNNPPGSSTLAIKFSNETKNYKMYFDGAFYVGEKRFDSVADLVHDGLISFYIEKHASNYIAMMSEENNYSESPYVASRTALLARQNRSPIHQINLSTHQSFATASGSSVANNSILLNPLPQQFQMPQSRVQPIPQFPTHSSALSQSQLTFQFSGSQLVIDKENRSASTNLSNQSSNLTINNLNRSRNSGTAAQNSGKSNAIFDRFDIMNSEKSHRFKSQNFKGPHWCDYCLNFMWGLVSQGVKCQDCGFQAHKKCSECVPADCEPQMKFIKRVFGVDLTTLVKATSSIRPIVVEKCIDEIEKRKGALETEGLYRVSGFNDAVEELKLAFDRGDNIDLSDTSKYNDIHIVCSLLKMYFRQLPIPLITFDIYNRLIDLLNNCTNTMKTNLSLAESIKSCIVELPPAHYLTLKYLMEHLCKISRFSNKNQMNNENLSIVFGPTLMRSFNPDPIIALKNTHKEQKIAEILISNYFSIFDK